MSTNLVPITESYTTTETGGRGLVSTEMTEDFDVTDNDNYKIDPSLKSSKPNDIIEMLLEISDGLDNNDNEVIADFTDFLIKKFAEATDPTVSYNNLMIKINNSDAINTSEIIKKLTKIYSRTILLELSDSKDIISAKNSALKKILNRADQYLSE